MYYATAIHKIPDVWEKLEKRKNIKIPKYPMRKIDEEYPAGKEAFGKLFEGCEHPFQMKDFKTLEKNLDSDIWIYRVVDKESSPAKEQKYITEEELVELFGEESDGDSDGESNGSQSNEEEVQTASKQKYVTTLYKGGPSMTFDPRIPDGGACEKCDKFDEVKQKWRHPGVHNGHCPCLGKNPKVLTICFD